MGACSAAEEEGGGAGPGPGRISKKIRRSYNFDPVNLGSGQRPFTL